MLVFPNGSTQSGEWKDDCLNGKGVSVDSDGTTYVGEWKHGTRIGKGVLTKLDDTKKSGEWKDGRLNGFGVFQSPFGFRYTEEWKHGRPDCKGQLKFTSSNSSHTYTYNGDWRANKRHGRGVMQFISGAIYDGEFQDDVPCGRGVLTIANSTELE
jgi:hypothetical protein